MPSRSGSPILGCSMTAAPAPHLTIDHTLYPHIMDMIFSYAATSRSRLLLLRQLSRTFRNRVDAVFASHMVLHQAHDDGDWPTDAETLHITTPSGRIPALMEWHDRSWRNTDFWGTEPIPPPLAGFFPHVKTIDMVGVLPFEELRRISGSLDHLHTQRIRRYADKLTEGTTMRARRFVIFSPLCAALPCVHKGVRRVVLNLAYPSGYCSTPRVAHVHGEACGYSRRGVPPSPRHVTFRLPKLPSTLRSFVLCFTPSDKDELGPQRAGGGGGRTRSLLRSVAMALLLIDNPSEDILITLVGLHTMPREMLGLDPDSDGDSDDDDGAASDVGAAGFGNMAVGPGAQTYLGEVAGSASPGSVTSQGGPSSNSPLASPVHSPGGYPVAAYLSPAASPAQAPVPFQHVPQPHAMGGNAAAVEDAELSAETGDSYTFDGETRHSPTPPLTVAERLSETKAALHAEWLRKLQTDPRTQTGLRETLETIYANMVWATHEEYKESLGEEAWRLETVERDRGQEEWTVVPEGR